MGRLAPSFKNGVTQLYVTRDKRLALSSGDASMFSDDIAVVPAAAASVSAAETDVDDTSSNVPPDVPLLRDEDDEADRARRVRSDLPDAVVAAVVRVATTAGDDALPSSVDDDRAVYAAISTSRRAISSITRR